MNPVPTAAVWPAPARTALPAANLFHDPRLLWAVVALAGIVLVGVLLIWWVDRWRKRPFEPPEAPGDQLAHFRELFERGQLSPEEFERIRSRLGQEVDVPPQDRTPNSPPAP